MVKRGQVLGHSPKREQALQRHTGTLTLTWTLKPPGV